MKKLLPQTIQLVYEFASVKTEVVADDTARSLDRAFDILFDEVLKDIASDIFSLDYVGNIEHDDVIKGNE